MSELQTVYKCRKCGYELPSGRGWRSKCPRCGDDLHKTVKPQPLPKPVLKVDPQGEIRLYRGLFKVRVVNTFGGDRYHIKCEVEAVEAYGNIEKGTRWKTFLKTLHHQVKEP